MKDVQKLVTSVLCSAQSLSHVQVFVSTRQAPLSMGILQARILEWAAISPTRGFSRLRD